ncbi:MAG: SGNH/GDSL hydrolase family protein [Dysgonamonadaceae bacterium]|jgi:hypothetical protein|nr:SGNH/GDSL hydrolase family protein [Dysgonamonadaceae bacterium]
MNKISAILVSILFIVTSQIHAQLVYHNADQFPLLGKISDKTETRYERLPSNIKEKTRPPVWGLGKNTAGLAIRFSSDATSIGLRWTLFENRVMNHMTPTGIKGFDLYCLEGREWEFVNSARPNTDTKKNQATIISNMIKKEREYLLFFPLYDGVVSLEIGIDSLASIAQPKKEVIKTDKPVICYGTSILQGGCASRPGMAHTNILMRRLNREFINLGFSGNGQLDYEIAEIMAEREAAMYILDFMPNVNVQQIREKMKDFYAIIRRKAPHTPIVFIENPIFPQGRYDSTMWQTVEEKNKVLHQIFNQLIKEGEKNIRLIPSKAMIGSDGEATVDGIHFTDLGFLRYADYLCKTVFK